MPGFFDAINNIEPPKEKVHTVTIAGQSIVVTLEKKLEVMRNGEDAYKWKSATEFVLKPKPKVGIVYPQLRKADKGYNFYDNDPYYPKDIVEEGFAWQIDTE
jgi:hypothetical protein